MNRRLLTPRWVLVHLVFVAAVVATCWLGWWQWERAHEAGGSFRNLGYALQWPLFGAFTIFLWYQVTRMDSRNRGENRGEEPADTTSEEETVVAEEPVRRRRLVPPPAPPVDEDEDPELVAYNRYLAELNESDERR